MSWLSAALMALVGILAGWLRSVTQSKAVLNNQVQSAELKAAVTAQTKETKDAQIYATNQAESYDNILRDNPELATKLGISVRPNPSRNSKDN